jgi:hypothetical protein
LFAVRWVTATVASFAVRQWTYLLATMAHNHTLASFWICANKTSAKPGFAEVLN